MKRHKAPGMLPSPRWMKENGYTGLYRAMCLFPEAFAHIDRCVEVRTADKWIPIAEKLAKEHKGVLPRHEWLKHNGYGGLCQTIRKNPEAFAHIKQIRKYGKTTDEWVAIAKTLIKDNDGTLPTNQWLIDNGFGGLVQRKRNHPAAFQQFTQDYCVVTPEEWLPRAEALAKENGGRLPNASWLIANGLNGLYIATRNHPDLFTHLKITRLRRTAKEWLPLARKLARENGGLLPSTNRLTRLKHHGLCCAIASHPELFVGIKQEDGWEYKRAQNLIALANKAKSLRDKYGILPSPKRLDDMKLWTLTRAMKRHPEAFRGIKQEQKRKPLSVHVNDAKQLVAKHGALPNQAWLKTNGYASLHQCFMRHPEAFDGIKQVSKRGKTLDEHVKDAERLEKQHGLLPNYAWLKSHGYNGLHQCKALHPEAFVHIRQRSKRGKNILEHVRDAEKLERKHGKVPNCNWLIANGHRGLYAAIKAHPEHFKHIRQKSKKGKCLADHIKDAKRLARENGGVLPIPQWLRDNGYGGLRHSILQHRKAFAHIRRDKCNNAGARKARK